ncbi:MAG: hypothetical protein Q8S12_10375 [Hydrogenophaga sp.]|jgi:hypothetical protein|nr:hypothetical protein [Hydrogenophaga sp.]
MTELEHETVRATVVAQSAQVRHVLAEAEGGQLLAVTKRTFEGNWDGLRRGDVLEVTKTREPLCKVLHARLRPD